MTDNPNRRTCEIIDRRENYSCIICGRSLYTTPGARHHRKPRRKCSDRNRHNPSNLILVCGIGNNSGCHGRIHKHPQQAYENGWLVHSWDDPASTPILTHDGWMLLDDDGNESEYHGDERDAKRPDVERADHVD